MDFLSVLGWLGGIGVILFGILFDKDKGIVFDNLKNFFDASSVMVVLGGVIVALMVSFPFSIFKKIPRHLKIILFPTKFVPQDYISQIVELATEARINGLLSLESKLQDDDGGGKKKKGKGDPFLRNSMMLIVDAVDPERLRRFWRQSLITSMSAMRRTAPFMIRLRPMRRLSV